MTRIDEIKQKITELKAQAKTIGNNPIATLEEVQDIHNKLKVEYEKLRTEELIAQNKGNTEGTKFTPEDKEKKYRTAFYNMLKGKVTAEDIEIIRGYNKLSSTVDADGGYIIPVDQVTRINELKKARFSFRNYVNVEPVSTKSGTRIIEKNADEVPFSVLTEGNSIADTDSPQFVQIKYDIKDYAGILPVPNNLINDTDVAIEAYLNKWLARKSNATDNKLVLDIIDKIATKTAVQTIGELKKLETQNLI